MASMTPAMVSFTIWSGARLSACWEYAYGMNSRAAAKRLVVVGFMRAPRRKPFRKTRTRQQCSGLTRMLTNLIARIVHLSARHAWVVLGLFALLVVASGLYVVR